MILTPRNVIEDRIKEWTKLPAGNPSLVDVVEKLMMEEIYRQQ